jgi:Domain of unknown function (DUF4375)
MGYWAILEPYWEQIDIYEGGAHFLETYLSVPAVARVLAAAHWCDAEVTNGGFLQFFQNPTGVLAPEAVAAFDAIGLGDVGAIVQDAMSFFGARYPREQQDRLRALPDIGSIGSDPFEALDRRFYAACAFDLKDPDSGRIYDALDVYAAKHVM